MIKGSIIPELFSLKNLYYTTVRIQLFDKDGIDAGCGTGFFFHVHELDDHHEDITTTLLITNRHVIEEAHTASVVLHLGPAENGIPMGGVYTLDIENLNTEFKSHPDPEIDLCALDVTQYLQEIAKEEGCSVHYQAFSYQHIPFPKELSEIFPASDVFMVGYPDGLWDESNNLPITRKGITASHPAYDFNGKSRGAVDIATFTGSSGSPIILYRQGPIKYGAPADLQFWLLGILKTAGFTDAEGKMVERDIPTKRTKVPLTQMMIHLGYYVKGREILAFDDMFRTDLT